MIKKLQQENVTTFLLKIQKVKGNWEKQSCKTESFKKQL